MVRLPPRLVSGTAVSSLGRAVGTLLSIGTIAVITRSLVAAEGTEAGVAAYGIYATVLAYVAVFSILADGGLSLIFTREASRGGADESALFEVAWRLRVVGVLLMLAAAGALAFLLPSARAVRVGILVGMWGTAFQLLTQIFLGIFQKRLRLAIPALAEVAGRFAHFLLAVVVARIGGGVLLFLGAFVAGTAVTFLFTVVGARRFLPFRLRGRFDSVEARRILGAAWPIAASLILSMVFFKIDTVMLSLLRPAGDVALYALPYKVLESLLFFPAMVGGMLLPVFSRASAGRVGGVAEPLRASVTLYLLGALPAASLLFWAAPWIVGVLGGEAFGASAPVLRILAVALGVLFFGNLFGNAVVAIGEQRRLLSIYGLLTVVNVGANLLLIPRYTYLGAAWATVGTEVLSVALAARILARRRIPLSLSPRAWRIVLSGAVLVVLLFLPVAPPLQAAAGVAGFLAAILWTRAVAPRDVLRLLRAQRLHASS